MFTLPNHPFRFGVLNYPACADLIARARIVEDLGYDVFLLSDHFFAVAPMSGLAAVAEATAKVRIGSMVLGNDFWHPAILARELLAIDCLSNGRLEFGLGSGWYSEDYKQTGIPMDSPGVRISRLEESSHVLKGLLSGEKVSFHGKYYNIDELALSTKPIQQPHPPILIGGGSKRVLSLAASQADIVGFNCRTTATGGLDPISMTLEATQQKADWVYKDAGERLPGLELSILVNDVVITDSIEPSIRKIIEDNKNWWWTNLTPEQVTESPHFLLGSVEQIADKIIQNRERFGISYYVVFEGALESFAPVVKRMAGK